MEYLEAYDEIFAALDMIEDGTEDKQLDILDRDRIARESGEKPAAEWVRQDFKDLLYQYPKLRHLRTCELKALLLIWRHAIDGVVYYTIGDLKYLQQRYSPIWYGLAIPGYYSCERRDMAVEKLWKIWRSLSAY